MVAHRQACRKHTTQGSPVCMPCMLCACLLRQNISLPHIQAFAYHAMTHTHFKHTNTHKTHMPNYTCAMSMHVDVGHAVGKYEYIAYIPFSSTYMCVLVCVCYLCHVHITEPRVRSYTHTLTARWTQQPYTVFLRAGPACA